MVFKQEKVRACLSVSLEIKKYQGSFLEFVSYFFKKWLLDQETAVATTHLCLLLFSKCIPTFV